MDAKCEHLTKDYNEFNKSDPCPGYILFLVTPYTCILCKIILKLLYLAFFIHRYKRIHSK